VNCVIWGATGQAKVVRPMVEAGRENVVVALFDNNPACVSPFPDTPLLGGWNAFERFRAKLEGQCGFVVAIGGDRGEARCELAERLVDSGLKPLTIVHERAFLADDARVGQGCQVLAMAAVCVSAELGDFCIVNTGACVDHDCCLGRGVHVMPSATLAGEVTVGDHATIGTNATVLPRTNIGARAAVGAGAVVTRDVRPGATVVGVPASEVPGSTSSTAEALDRNS